MTAPLSPKQLAAYERSNDGMIAANIEMETICGPGGGSVWLWGKEANSRVVLSGNEIQPGVAIVSPGTYFPYHATCWGYNFTADLPNVDSWFLPFRVEAQTIVHLGTFTASAVNVEVDRSDLNVAAAAVVTFGLSLLISFRSMSSSQRPKNFMTISGKSLEGLETKSLSACQSASCLLSPWRPPTDAPMHRSQTDRRRAEKKQKQD